MPEFVFKRHAGLVSIDDNGALENIRLSDVFELVHQAPADPLSIAYVRLMTYGRHWRCVRFKRAFHLRPSHRRQWVGRTGTILLRCTSDQPTPLRRQGNANV